MLIVVAYCAFIFTQVPRNRQSFRPPYLQVCLMWLGCECLSSSVPFRYQFGRMGCMLIGVYVLAYCAFIFTQVPRTGKVLGHLTCRFVLWGRAVSIFQVVSPWDDVCSFGRLGCMLISSSVLALHCISCFRIHPSPSLEKGRVLGHLTFRFVLLFAAKFLNCRCKSLQLTVKWVIKLFNDWSFVACCKKGSGFTSLNTDKIYARHSCKLQYIVTRCHWNVSLFFWLLGYLYSLMG